MEQPTTRWVLGHKVTPFITSGDYDLAMGETPAKVQGPPPHMHNSYKESFLIVEGELEFLVNGEIRIVKAGEAVDIPPKTVHTFNNTSDFPCKWVNIHSPKGFMSFFEKMGIPTNETDALYKSVAPQIIQQVLATAADFDMHIEVI